MKKLFIGLLFALSAIGATAQTNHYNILDVPSSGGGMSIGGSITSGTPSALLYVGTGPVLSQASITGLVLGAGASAPGAYTGTSCTNQFPRSLNASGAATCASASLTADVSGILPTANGGTGIAYFTAAGPTAARIYTFPDAAATILYSGGALGTPASGVATNLTGTAASLTAGTATLATTATTATGTNALYSATTTVNVSSATAPTSGQVLTATGGTAATWQAPAGGGITIGTTTITSGTSTRALYDLSGVVQESSTLVFNAGAGQGPSIVAGTATTALAASTLTQTRNGSVAHPGVTWTFTDTSLGASSLYFQIFGGASGNANVLKLDAANYLLTIGDGGNGSTGGAVRFSGTYLSNGGGGGQMYVGTSYNGTDGSIETGTVAIHSSFGAIAGRKTISSTAPTLASGGCTSPTAVTATGTSRFSVGVGTGCSGSQPLVFTLVATTNGWACTAQDSSNSASNAPRQTGAVSTTSVTITNFAATTGLATAWTDSDVVVVKCLGG